MSFPNFEISTGLKLTPDGRDVQVLWPSDGLSWTAATVRAKLWQIKGQWKYDLDRGIEYDRILGVPSDLREVQEIYRREISDYVDLTSLTVRLDDGEIFVDWAGSGPDEQGTISLLEPPAVDTVEPIKWIHPRSDQIVIQFSEVLNAARVPAVGTFELLNTGSTVTAASILGNHLFLTVDPYYWDAFTLLYNPDNQPMQSKARVNVAPFRVEIPSAQTSALLTEDGHYILTEAGDRILLG